VVEAEDIMLLVLRAAAAKQLLLKVSRISTFGTIFELRNGGFLAHRSH